MHLFCFSIISSIWLLHSAWGHLQLKCINQSFIKSINQFMYSSRFFSLTGTPPLSFRSALLFSLSVLPAFDWLPLITHFFPFPLFLPLDFLPQNLFVLLAWVETVLMSVLGRRGRRSGVENYGVGRRNWTGTWGSQCALWVPFERTISSR